MAETKQAWNDVAEQFSDLGLKLKLHIEEALPSDEKVKKALEGLRDSLEHAFSAVGDTIKDPAVKQDVSEVARSLRDALSATFTEVNDDLRNCFKPKPKSDTQDDGS